MSRRRTRTVRRRRRFGFPRRFGRRHKDKRISIIGTAGLVGSFFTPAAGHMSAGEWVTSGRIFHPQGEDLKYFADDLLAQYTGISMVNGFNFTIPYGLVTIIGSQIGAKIAQKFGGNQLSKLPFVGKYVKW